MSTNFETLREYLNEDKTQEAAILLIRLCPILKDCSSCDSCILKILQWGHSITSGGCNESNCRELERLITELKIIIGKQKQSSR